MVSKFRVVSGESGEAFWIPTQERTKQAERAHTNYPGKVPNKGVLPMPKELTVPMGKNV